MEAERIFAARHVVTPDGVRPAWIHVAAGKVVAVRAEPPPPAVPVEDFGERWLLPGLVDTHVHVNEPGRAEWEGFDTATAAAAAGGICTIVDMPLNSIPATTSAAALRVKRDAAERAALRVDVALWGGVVPGLAERHGCRVHVVHLATGEALDDLRRARARGVAVTAETCPHYLTFGAEEIANGATPFKCAPPIRERAERERLWGGLRDGVI